MNNKDSFDLPSLNEARKRIGDIPYVDFNLDDDCRNLGKGKTYFIKTHGCQANQRDSETMAGILDSIGFRANDSEKGADVIIINTCAVRQGAEEKVYGEIGALKRLKRENPDIIIAIAGCMAQEEKTIREISAKYPQVDLVFGTHNITNLPKLLNNIYHERKRLIEVFSNMGEIVENVPVTRFAKHKAWVNIMYGCDKFCTYCIVPYTRGKERSRLMEDVLAEIKVLKEEGYKEVCLLGQNVNAYGNDLKLGYSFGDLLEEAARIGIERIRFVTSHPWNFDDRMIEAMRDNPNIMPYLHLPLQSGNTEILRRMNRRYSAEEYLELFKKLKETLPHYAFTTDIIVGFPNESDEAFEDTLKMVDYCQYDNAYTFIYSPREGTPAAKMEDNVPMAVKEERLQRLNEKITFYANKANQKFKDQIVEVLVDGISKRNGQAYSGYTPENKLVNFTGNDVKVGEIVKVRITEAKSFSLDGVMVE